MPDAIKVCSICQETYEGWGNNAAPVNSGRCCDGCNATVVLPARITLLRRSRAAPEPRPRPPADEG